MSNSVLYMSMSLAGYIAGRNEEPGNPGGDDFMRLHEWCGFDAPPPNAKGTGWGKHERPQLPPTVAMRDAQVFWTAPKEIKNV